MASNGVNQTAKGNLRHAKIGNIYKQVKRLWKQISDEIIINSFKSYHISNTLDDLAISDDDSIEDSDKENFSDNDDIEQLKSSFISFICNYNNSYNNS